MMTVAWMGYYNYRVFGSPLTLPYTVNRNPMLWRHTLSGSRPGLNPYTGTRPYGVFIVGMNLSTTREFTAALSIKALIKALEGVLFFAGIALLPPLLMLRRVLADRRIRFLLVCMAVLIAGLVVQIFLLPHYLAPFTAVFYALGLQAMRHLRLAKIDRRPVGLGWVRLTVTICIVLAGIRLFAGPLHLNVPEWPASKWSFYWYGPAAFGAERYRVEKELEQLPGKHLALVRYSPGRPLLDEWVYNAADIDASRVIWAREMGAAENLELIHYYQDRHVWLVQPDLLPAAPARHTLSHACRLENASTGAQLPSSSTKKETAQEVQR